MTVKDLIEVLQQCPEPDADTHIRLTWRPKNGSLEWADYGIADIHEDHGVVILETEPAE